MQQILKEQVEESRQQLKKEMEQRMIVEKNCRQGRNNLININEGLQDVVNVLGEIIEREQISCQSI